MARIHIFALLLGAFLSLAFASCKFTPNCPRAAQVPPNDANLAAAAPTFCKCTCFKNSTIIPLGPEHEQQGSRSVYDASDDTILRNPLLSPRDADQSEHARRSATSSCTACTKAFCLSQGIDFCKDATEEDVFTQCFQRDSNKDKIMVWAFITSTLGLLGWAAFKRFVQWRDGRLIGRQDINYAPVSGGR